MATALTQVLPAAATVLPALDPVAAAVLRGTLALLFGVAAVHKLRDRDAFGATLGEYRLLPGAALGAAASLVPAAELAAATLLAVPATAPAGAVAAALLLAVYSLAIAINLARGRRDLDCGCMGPAARRPIGAGLVVRNAVLLAAAAACLLPVGGRALVWVDALTVPAAIAAAAALYAGIDRLLANAPGLAALRAELRAHARAVEGEEG